MATLGAMFRIYDRYSTVLDRINNTTIQATNRILGASSATDRLNTELAETQRNSNGANDGLSRMLKTLIGFAGTKKGMDIVDNYSNINARLSLINDGLQTQLELQDKIFASAERSKGSYSDMAGAIAKMGLMASESFGSNDELIAFTELIQKGFKVGGSSQMEQSSAMLQLTQAMGAGKLQGDEFRSIMENAPMIADAIAKYVGVSKGELKSLSSTGAITADIIKNAMFASADQINERFSKMPMTFADYWTKMKNDALRAFRLIIEGVSKLINNDTFIKTVDIISTSFYILASVIGSVFGFIGDNFEMLMPLFIAFGAVILTGIITKLWGMVAPMIANVNLMNIMSSKIFLIGLVIGVVIGILLKMGVTFEDLFGYIGGGIGFILGLFENLGIAVQNVFLAVMKVIEVIILSIVNAMIDGINAVIGMINKIPGMEIGTIKHLGSHFEGKEFKEFTSLTDRYNQGVDKGKDIYGAFSSRLDSLTNFGSGAIDFGDFGNSQNPLNVTSKDKLKVDISKENLQYLRDIAEREYVNKFSTATLAPQINVNVGEVNETADLDQVVKRVGRLLKEEITLVSEGEFA